MSHIITKLKLRIAKVYANKTHGDVKSQFSKIEILECFFINRVKGEPRLVPIEVGKME